MRLAELMGTLSTAADVGMGMPSDHGLRCAVISVRLAELCGAEAAERSDAYYLSFLRYAGCTADSDVAASVMGDEVRVRSALYGVDWRDPGEFLSGLSDVFGARKSLRGAATLVRALGRIPRMMGSARAHCEVGDRLSEHAGFESGFRAALFQAFERWDGRGWPDGVKGPGIARAMRIAQVAEDLEVGQRSTGRPATRLLAKRRSKSLDPTIVDVALEHAPDLCAAIDVSSPWDAAMNAEPEPRRMATEAQVDETMRAMADFADLKSNYTRGHSRGVAALARAAAERLRLPPQTVSTIERAAYLHDLGRIAVSAGIWDKRGGLTDAERESVRLHTYATERILSRAAGLDPFLRLATAAHERLTGSGYHRGLSASNLAMPGRVLAAADVYRALTEARPHRPAFDRTGAARLLGELAEQGELCHEAVRAVLEAAGHARKHRDRVAVLTEREADVLRLVARGHTNKEVAVALDISVKTAGRHLENIFAKIGVTTRAAAAVWAMQKGLCD